MRAWGCRLACARAPIEGLTEEISCVALRFRSEEHGLEGTSSGFGNWANNEGFIIPGELVAQVAQFRWKPFAAVLPLLLVTHWKPIMGANVV